jgi:hypothetical protein
VPEETPDPSFMVGPAARESARQSLALAVAGPAERDEPDRAEVARRSTALGVLRDRQQGLLGLRLADRDDEHPARLELLEERVGDVVGPAGDHHRVERGGVRPALIPVPRLRVDVLVAKRLEALLGCQAPACNDIAESKVAKSPPPPVATFD